MSEDPVASAPAVAAAPVPSFAEMPWWARRRTWWELFLQFGAVLLGVVGGTLVTEWREDRAALEVRQRSLQGIANEIEFNRTLLKSRQEYYQKVVDEIIQVLKEKGEQAEYRDLKSFRGFNPIIVRDSSFQVSIQSQAFGRLEYALAEEIASVYARQEWVKGGVSKWMDYVVQHKNMSLPVKELGGIFQDWVGMTGEMVGAYERLQTRLPAAQKVELR